MFENWQIPNEIKTMLINSKSIVIPKNREELLILSLGNKENKIFNVEYNINGKNIREAVITKCKNGIAVNYEDINIRRRDPDCLFVGDDLYSDKPKFDQKFNFKFFDIRKETIDWLGKQDLIVMPFLTGGNLISYKSLFIGPKNAAFFAGIIADLQQIIDIKEIETNFKPEIILYLTPTFRHTHFNGKQVVVHKRDKDVYEIFSYNMYPGPSAKKGLYGALLHIGEKENWLTLHASAVKIKTPYENIVVILHEGASGGGKSEMNEEIERQEDGSIILAENIITKEKIRVYLKEESKIYPITDDMTLCHPSIQNKQGKLVIADAEKAWFVRVDHIKCYGTNPVFEKMTIHPKKPIFFLNIYAVPDATCLIWEHIEDEVGKPCPNPRVIFPRDMIENIVNEPVEIDYRSFGIRTPPTYRDNIGYGIYGFMHILPPALAWIYRLVAPRGYNNPSIVKTIGLTSEGIGTYGPFLTGSIIRHANLLLDQFIQFSKVQYVLFPNQYVGCWYVGFMAQWIGREYLARRGNRPFINDELIKSKYPLLGYTKKILKVEDIVIPEFLLRVESQKEIGEEVFDASYKILYDFFKSEIKKYDNINLSATGRKIIQCFMDNGTLENFEMILKI
jgi:hypothetical protein